MMRRYLGSGDEEGRRRIAMVPVGAAGATVGGLFASTA